MTTKNSGKSDPEQARLDAAFAVARRRYDLRVLALDALVELYGRLPKLMPKKSKGREFRAAAKIRRAIYANGLRQARAQRNVLRRVRQAMAHQR